MMPKSFSERVLIFFTPFLYLVDNFIFFLVSFYQIISPVIFLFFFFSLKVSPSICVKKSFFFWKPTLKNLGLGVFRNNNFEKKNNDGEVSNKKNVNKQLP